MQQTDINAKKLESFIKKSQIDVYDEKEMNQRNKGFVNYMTKSDMKKHSRATSMISLKSHMKIDEKAIYRAGRISQDLGAVPSKNSRANRELQYLIN